LIFEFFFEQYSHSELEASDLDKEFMQFLIKTKENLSRLSQASDNEDDECEDEESDSVFLNFIMEMKKGLPIEFEN
ncbi:hypothetical protein HNY73_011692, partial [Argiope bruennichi]